MSYSSNPMDCSPPGSSVHGIYQARTLEWVVISFSRESSQSGDQTQVSPTAGRFFTIWATRETSRVGTPECGQMEMRITLHLWLDIAGHKCGLWNKINILQQDKKTLNKIFSAFSFLYPHTMHCISTLCIDQISPLGRKSCWPWRVTVS